MDRDGDARRCRFGKNVDVLVAAVRAARLVSDTVVVYLHWGIEGHTCPSSDQRALAQALVLAGADVVVGSHAHRLLGGGRLGSAFVDYGLGNFAFYARRFGRADRRVDGDRDRPEGRRLRVEPRGDLRRNARPADEHRRDGGAQRMDEPARLHRPHFLSVAARSKDRP